MSLVIFCLGSTEFSLSFHVASQESKYLYLYDQNISIHNSYQPSWKRQETRTEAIMSRIPNFALCRSYGILVRHRSYGTHQDGSNFYENHDTISHDDVVKKQYSSLPYPPVNEYQIELEKIHYMSNYSKQYPFDMYAPITLENINHFLFNGNNNFRLACLNF